MEQNESTLKATQKVQYDTTAALHCIQLLGELCTFTLRGCSSHPDLNCKRPLSIITIQPASSSPLLLHRINVFENLHSFYSVSSKDQIIRESVIPFNYNFTYFPFISFHAPQHMKAI